MWIDNLRYFKLLSKNGDVCLNVGCGIQRFPGFINTDINPDVKPDMIWDITKKSEFTNEQLDYIFCNNVLEHLFEFVPAVQEFHRILKLGGTLHIIVPHYSYCFWDMPSHKRSFSYFTFKHFQKSFTEYRNIEDTKVYFESVKCRFVFGKKLAVWNYIIEPIANLFPIIYEQTCFHSLFPCIWIEAVLTK